MRSHRLVALALFAVAAICAAVPLACGGGDTPPPAAVCGNGIVETGEQCDLGPNNGADGYPCSALCRSVSVARSQINLSWSILSQTGVTGFDRTNCGAIGAEQAQILIVGPNNLQIHQLLDCTRYTTVIGGVCVRPDGGSVDDCSTRLPLGSYKATITLIRADHTAVTEEVTTPSRMNTRHGEMLTMSIDFGLTNLLNRGSLKGSLLLDLSWGEPKKTCDSASPAVEKESLWLAPMEGLKPLSGMTIPGVALDGTPGPCFVAGKPPNANRLSEEAPNILIGQYRLHIKGYAGNNAVYCKNLDVFVGPGSNTVAYQILVPAVVAGDGGVCL